MIFKTEEPSAWHVAPSGIREVCTVCGCPMKYLGRKSRLQHRAADPAAPDETAWFTRRASGAFWDIKQVGVEKPKPTSRPPEPRRVKVVKVPNSRDRAKLAKLESITEEQSKRLRDAERQLRQQTAKARQLEDKLSGTARGGRKKPGPPRADQPTERVAEMMGRASAMFIHGKRPAEIAKALDVTQREVRYWQKRWPDRWQALVDKAGESLLLSIRAMANTDRILDDPDAYVRTAKIVDDWAKRKGVELFPAPDGETTLSGFYETWYVPNRLNDATEDTKEAYRIAVGHWRLLTGDPPVKAITNETVARFRNALSKMRGRSPIMRMSPNSVRSYMRFLQVLLDKLGPPGRGNRDGLDILERVPWAKPPREVVRIPRTITLEQFSACITASLSMDEPQLSGVKAPAWWRALFVVAWNTGERIGTLLSMRMAEIDWAGKRIVLPADRMKSRRPKIVYLNAAALNALRSIRTDRKLIFPWPSNDYRSTFYKRLHKLQDVAGIPREDQFGFHPIRKTVATMLWEINPGAAQCALGHTTNDVTKKHYVDGGGMVARALDQLPQPAVHQDLEARLIAD